MVPSYCSAVKQLDRVQKFAATHEWDTNYSAYSNSRTSDISSQRVGLCNPLSVWAVITTEQVPTGPASKYTMYCTLSVSSVYYKVCGLRYTLS